MKQRWVLSILFTILSGSLLHFFHDWFPVPLVGLFAPVNESVWEHLKLLFWPFLLGCFLLKPVSQQSARFWGAALSASLIMPLLLTGTYYLLSSGFLIQSLTIDLALYVLSILIGFAVLARWQHSAHAEYALGVLILLTALYAACLILFSIAAPALPIFISSQ